jgi:hypothetical protein
MTSHQSDFTCRVAEESDFPGIVELFRRNGFGPRQLDWIKWKYLRSPDGPVRLHIATTPDEKVIAIIARLPRRFTSAQTGPFLIFQVIDMLVDEKVRGKGVYSRLAESNRSRDYLTFGFPNEFSERTMKEEVDTVLPIEIWQFPVSVGRVIAGKAYGFLFSLADALSRLYTFLWLGRSPKSLEMKPINRFERDFELDPRLLHGVRSADYLNWRFIDNPNPEWSAFEFFDRERSIGYCVYAEVRGVAKIFDLVVSQNYRKCLRALVNHCFNSRITHIEFEGVGLELGKYGFLRRRSGRKLVLSDTWGGLKVPQGHWFVTLADKD